jgi:hypothetical protein
MKKSDFELISQYFKRSFGRQKLGTNSKNKDE